MREEERQGIGAPGDQGPVELLGGEGQTVDCETCVATIVRQELVEVRSCAALADEDLVETIRRLGYKGKVATSERRPEEICGPGREAAMEGVCFLDLVQQRLENIQAGQALLDEDVVEKIRRFGCKYRGSG
jgi:hypothetical protein